MSHRRTFSPAFKTQVVLALVSGTKSVAQICGEYDLNEHVVARWRTAFLERVETIFAGDVDRQHQLDRIADRERLVGRLTLELEVANKASALWAYRSATNGS